MDRQSPKISSDREPYTSGRRSLLLKSAMSLAATVSIAGCSSRDEDSVVKSSSPETPPETESRTPTREPDEFEEQRTSSTTPEEWQEFSVTQVSVTPGDEVSGIVENIEANELLVFPSGRFRWSNETTLTKDGWGVWCQPDTVFEVPSGIGDGDDAEMIATDRNSSTADDFLLKNLTFDSDGRAAPGLGLGVRKDATVDGLEYRMNGPTSSGWQENGLRAYVKDPDGLLEISDYRQFNNGNLGSNGGGDGRVGIFVGPRHEGAIRLRNPVLQGFPNNACYVSHHQGTVVVEGGLLLNNNVSAVRVSGGVDVRNTTIVIDLDRYLKGPGVLEGNAHNTRGIWGDTSGGGPEGGTVRGASFIINSYDRCTGLATILDNPIITLEECQFLLNTRVVAVRADNGEIVLEDCAFGGLSPESVAGVDNISGSNNTIAPNIQPGNVPVASRKRNPFEWSRTHASTPGRVQSCSILSKIAAVVGRTQDEESRPC